MKPLCLLKASHFANNDIWFLLSSRNISLSFTQQHLQINSSNIFVFVLNLHYQKKVGIFLKISIALRLQNSRENFLMAFL